MELTFSHHQTEDHQVKLKIEIPFHELKKKFDALLAENTAKLNLPGFRKGKAPPALVKARYAKPLKAQVVESLTTAAVDQVVKQEKLKTYGPPHLVAPPAPTYDENLPLKLEINFALQPECSLGATEGLTVAFPSYSSDQADVAFALDKLLRRFGSFTPIVEKRYPAADELLKVKLSFQAPALKRYELHEHPLVYRTLAKAASATAPFTPATLTAGGAVPSFLNELAYVVCSLTPGAEKTVTHSFSKSDAFEALSDKTLSLTVKLLSISTFTLPKLTPAFLEKLGYKTEAELKEKLKQEVERAAATKIMQEKQRATLEAVRQKAVFKIPALAVDYVVSQYWSELQQLAKQPPEGKKGTSNKPLPPPPKTPSEQWLQTARRRAAEEIQTQLLLEALEKKYAVAVAEAEVQEALEKIAKEQSQSPKTLRREMVKSGEYSKLKNQLKHQKLLKLMIDKMAVVPGAKLAAKDFI